MESLVQEMISCNFDELDGLDIPFDRKVGLTVYLDDVKYEFLVNLKSGNDKLLILTPSAINKSSTLDRTHPSFNRHSWEFPYSTINFNDPTRYLSPQDMDTGWCIGTRDNWYLPNISKIIMTIASKGDFEKSNIMFYGSSSGGFNSIQLATLNRGTRFLADIPQLNVSNYWPAHWNRIKKYCFNDMDEEQILSEYGYRISIIDLFNREKYFPKGMIMMDCSVEKDFNRQYTPFLYNLNNIKYTDKTQTIPLLITGKNKGHSVFPKDMSLDLVDYVFNDDFYGVFDPKYESNAQLVESLKRENEMMKSTVSWKITKPLRAIRKYIRF